MLGVHCDRKRFLYCQRFELNFGEISFTADRDYVAHLNDLTPDYDGSEFISIEWNFKSHSTLLVRAFIASQAFLRRIWNLPKLKLVKNERRRDAFYRQTIIRAETFPIINFRSARR